MAENIKSILDSVKKLLNIPTEYDAFDPEITIHINSVFDTLTQLGVGPKAGFEIEDSEEEWEDFLGQDKRLKSVKSYMYLRIRLLWDPPTNSFAIESMSKQIKELEYRLNVTAEGDE